MKFWVDIDLKERKKYSEYEIGCLQAVFLGERSATLNNNLAIIHFEQLTPFGFLKANGWVYDPKQVKKLMIKHRSAFALQEKEKTFQSLTEIQTGLLLGFPSTSVRRFAFFQSILDLQGSRKEKVQSIMQKSRSKNMKYLMSRLLENHKQLKLTPLERNFLAKVSRDISHVDIYGVCWVDFGKSVQSLKKQKKLKKAFLVSGLRR